MRKSIVLGLALLCTLMMAGSLMAQDGGGAGGAGGAGGRGGRGGFGGGMFQQDPLQQIVSNLGELNLRPDFSLTAEQKVKLQGIRDEAKKAQEKWRADNSEQLAQFRQQMGEARQDQEKMRELMTKQRELMQTMPKTDEAAKQVRALLTEDQAKALDAFVAERQQQMRDRMGAMGGAGGAGGRTRGNRGGNTGGGNGQ